MTYGTASERVLREVWPLRVVSQRRVQRVEAPKNRRVKRIVQITTSAMGIWIMEVFLLWLAFRDDVNRVTLILVYVQAALLAWKLYEWDEETK